MNRVRFESDALGGCCNIVLCPNRRDAKVDDRGAECTHVELIFLLKGWWEMENEQRIWGCRRNEELAEVVVGRLASLFFMLIDAADVTTVKKGQANSEKDSTQRLGDVQ